MTSPDHDRERGSISPAIPALFTALLLIIGLVVDGGAKGAAITTSQAACQQAVRVAGQQVVVESGRTVIDRANAYAAGQAALSAAGVQGSLSINGITITCTGSKTKRTVFLNIIGIPTVTGHGTASADLATGIQEAQ